MSAKLGSKKKKLSASKKRVKGLGEVVGSKEKGVQGKIGVQAKKKGVGQRKKGVQEIVK